MPASPDVASSLIAALADAGEHVDDGSFTLDPQQARAKLREFQLAEPLSYVLLLVEAATLASDRPHVSFRLGTTTVVQFAGVQLRDDDLRDPLAAVFTRSSGDAEQLRRIRVTQLLGLAANAALAAGAERVEVDSSDPAGVVTRVTLTADDDEPTRAVLREPGSGLAFRYCGGTFDIGRAARERALLIEHCEISHTAISVDGERIDAGFAAAFAGYRRVKTTAVAVDELGIIGQAARVGAEPAKALIMTHGVLAETVALDNCRHGLLAVVDVDLRKDLSQQRLLRDPAFQQVIAAIERADDRLPWAAATSRRETADEHAGLLGLMIALLVLAFAFVILIALLRG